MRAVVYDRYGPPEALRLEEIERPTPGEGEVLVKVESVSLNLSDWECLRGSPFYVRLFGLFRPRHRILGSDIAGRVEALGPGVTELAVGDAVFGDALGTFGGLDLVATRSPFAHRHAFRKGGTYAMVGGTMSALLQTLLLGPVVGRLTGTRIRVLGAQADKEDFATILDWIVGGKLKLTIDRRFPLEQTADAIRYHGEGHGLGKVLVVP